MTPAEFSIDKTASGLQYVIPGAERIEQKRRSFPVEDGGQFVIPGAERISTGEHLTRLMTKPMVPRRRQVGLHGTALFGRRPG